jgi:rod shape-determining protein MreD
MRLLPVLATVFVAVVLQAALARYTVGGRWVFDLVLVGVVYAALQQGAVAGMVAGTVGGLLQDSLSGGILGTGALTKTLTGFIAGGVATQFVVAKPHARTIIVAGATILNRAMAIGLDGLIHLEWPPVSWMAVLGEVVANSACAFVVFAAANALPGAMARGRMSRRTTFGRRQW